MAGTISSSAVNNVDIRAPHEGLFAKTVSVTAAGVTLSASVSIYVVNLPVGMHITDVKAGYSAGPATVTVHSVAHNNGTVAATATLTQSAAHSLLGVAATGVVGSRVSLSDDASPYYDTLKAIVTMGTATTTLAMTFTVEGYMEPA